jgi:hypothetical protein
MPRVLVALVFLCIAIPAIALAADTDPQKRITRADQAKARSVLLKRTDFVAGWKLQPPTPDSDLTCPGFNPDESDLTLSGEGEADFKHPQGFPVVYSSSEVWATKADALASWTRSTKPAVARCMAYFMKMGAEDEGGKLTVVSQGTIAFPKVAPRTVAYRVVARMTIAEAGHEPVTIPLTLHLIGLGNGRGDVGLMAMGIGAGVPVADLRFFAKLTAARLAAARL